jgi:two-component system, chemotaxis family, sensor histidine kinase and response regulator WspE
VSGHGLGGMSLLTLFLQEVETHTNALNQGLVALEQDPGASSLMEPLMRAAHSIKGAASIVGIASVVELAHAIEDGFVAGQKGEVKIEPGLIDIFLKAVDLLGTLAGMPEDETSEWLAAQAETFGQLAEEIRAALAGQLATAETPAPAPERAAKVGEADKEPEAKKTVDAPKTAERDLRVTAENLDRIMGHASEILVDTRRLPPFAEGLLQFKKRQARLVKTLQALRTSLESNDGRENAGLLVEEAIQHARTEQDRIATSLLDFDVLAQSLDASSNRLYRQALSCRMLPFAGGVQGFPRMVRDLARELGKNVRLKIIGKDTEVDRDILSRLEAPLNHLLRNALDHGIEPPEERFDAGKPPEGALRLEASHNAGMLVITVADDGRGINLERVRRKIVDQNLLAADMAALLTDAELLEFLLLPNFSTAVAVTRISGRGVGLDVVHTMIQELRGQISMESRPGEGTTIRLKLPLSLSVLHVLMVEVGGEAFALPLHRIDRILSVNPRMIQSLENRQYIHVDGQNIGLVPAAQLLGLEKNGDQPGAIPVVVLSNHANRFGLTVDRLLGERDLAVRPLDPRLGKVQDISAIAVLEDGTPTLIVDIDDLVRSVDNLLTDGRLKKIVRTVGQGIHAHKRLLVVDDSITVREMLRQLLENHGYDVTTAVDGVEGWNTVRAEEFELVISDVDMPRMNGIELVTQIKQNPKLKKIPVMIVSYKDREEDRRRGLDAGADYYLTKSSFHDETFLRAVVDLIGEA